MTSDRYILKPGTEDMDRVLDIAEHMAACYGFDKKELMRIRLLAEEMILSLRSGLMLAPGELWFHTENGMFVVTASINTDVSGMPREQRKKLLDNFKPAKRTGLFGIIQSFMDDMAVADSPMSLYGYAEAYCGRAAFYAQPFDTWSMERLEQLAPPPSAASKDEEFEREWETSLLKGFADDITVTSRSGLLEMSVMKKIPEAFSGMIAGASK